MAIAASKGSRGSIESRMHATLSLQYPLLPADDNAEFAAAAELYHIEVLLVSSNSLSIAMIYCAVLKNGLGQVALQASLAVLQKQYVTCLANSGTVGARTSARVCIPRASRPEWVSLLQKPRIDTVQIPRGTTWYQRLILLDIKRCFPTAPVVRKQHPQK